MKLYATTTSERASKGQGGNNHIKIDLFVGSTKQSRQVAAVTLVVLQNGGYELFYLNKETGKTSCLQTGELKGNKQKTAKCGNCGKPATQSIGESINRCDRCATE